MCSFVFDLSSQSELELRRKRRNIIVKIFDIPMNARIYATTDIWKFSQNYTSPQRLLIYCMTVKTTIAFSVANLHCSETLKGSDTVSFGTALTWSLVFSLWKEVTPTNQSTSSQCFAWFSIVYWKSCFWVSFFARPIMLLLS